MENNEFSFAPQTPAVATDGFTPEDFKFVQLDKSIHDQRFQGRSTTYLRDIVRRFAKNKTSVFGFCLFGLLILLAICFAIFLPGNADKTHPTPAEQQLPPKLFPTGTGFWDGTRKYEEYLFDTETGQPVLGSLEEDAILQDTLKTYAGTYNSETPYGHGGYVVIDPSAQLRSPVLEMSLATDGQSYQGQYSLTFDHLTYGLDTSYTAAPTFSIWFQGIDESGAAMTNVQLVSGLTIDTSLEQTTVDLSAYVDAIQANASGELPTSGRFIVQAADAPIFFEGLSLTSSSADWSAYAIDDASDDLMITRYNETSDTGDDIEGYANWWSRSSSQAVHGYQVPVTYCDFTYDPYEAVYGISPVSMTLGTLNDLKNRGAIDYQLEEDGVIIIDSLVELSDENYLIIGDSEYPMELKVSSGIAGTTWTLEAYQITYKNPTFGYTSMPIHIFGTDVNGLDMLKLVSIGMLYSLLIGIAVSAICFLIGLAWGSFSGYQGGLVDLGMERVVDVLSYIPGMVVITLFILNWGHTFWVFMLAMCVTGWISTSALTRTQFYRFKRREYVLASRSLGASDGRLIYRHILPNGLGTIITSSVLMIPSVIYSEASLAYLGLGLQDITSLGTIIQNNQSTITTAGGNPDLTYLIIFPSVVLALLLICFELFGQGLRDAVNPNTKGMDD